jgi:hypothetical protein
MRGSVSPFELTRSCCSIIDLTSRVMVAGGMPGNRFTQLLCVNPVGTVTQHVGDESIAITAAPVA